MEALLKSEAAIELLASISLAQFLVIAVVLISIGIIIYKFKDSIKDFLEEYRDKTNRKEQIMEQIANHDVEIKNLKKHHQEDMDSFYKKQLEYRKQSLNKQDAIEIRFNDITQKIDNLTELLNSQYEETKSLKRNELREKLLSNYRYYTSLENNPKQEWNEMEADAFWHLFSDYEKLGGNGFMHNTVKPAMESLKVITILS
jgi:ABC-type multidrug transport system fused ATPase/permease subunit